MIRMSKEDFDKLVEAGGKISKDFVIARSQSWYKVTTTQEDGSQSVNYDLQEGLFSVLEETAKLETELKKTREMQSR